MLIAPACFGLGALQQSGNPLIRHGTG